MGNYKLIALDMDGTVLTEDKLISAENRAAIQAAAAAGVTVMFATGRGIQNVAAYVEELQLAAPIVTVNGSEVWAAPGILHSRTLLDTALVKQMHDIALDYDTWYWAYAVGEIFNKENWTEQADEKQWLKFGYFYEDADKIHAIRTKLEAWGVL
ncbi:MAG: Cof-like hydrolase, partial [Paenibacillus sp.]|nr:Cof-like hydrolase [Paenibacillus sp.]